MGGSSWRDDYYEEREAARKASGKDAFDHNAKVNSGAAPKVVHTKLNPLGKVRESRDSDAHPNSNAIMVVFDVTGSMSSVPRVLQQNLPKLHGLLTAKGYITDPQILFGAVGDATCDRVPLQIGQFESGNEMEDDLARFILEGGGGGQNTESYELAMYYALKKTSLDCHEKRGQKGYLFLIGDENAYPNVSEREVKSVIGDDLAARLATRALVTELKEKFHCYFIIPNSTSNYREAWLTAHWTELFGQNVLRLEDPAGICECIAMAIGLNEGTTDLDSATDHIAEKADAMVVRAVRASVAHLAGTEMVTAAGAALVGKAPSGTTRL